MINTIKAHAPTTTSTSTPTPVSPPSNPHHTSPHLTPTSAHLHPAPPLPDSIPPPPQPLPPPQLGKDGNNSNILLKHTNKNRRIPPGFEKLSEVCHCIVICKMDDIQVQTHSKNVCTWPPD